MARITYGPLVTAIKGSIGGVTFQNNTSGTIIRSRPRPTRVSTTKQTIAHAALQQLLYEWQNITQSQRDEWNEYASVWTKENKFGESKTLTGQNWFTSVNWWRNELDETILAGPPAHTLPQAAPSFAMILSNSDVKINFLSAHDYVNNPVAVWSSLPTKKNTLSINQIRKLVYVFRTTPADPYNLTALWEAAIGLDWDPSNNFPDANIFFCLESIRESSGITSSMLCTKNETPSADEDSMYYYQ